MLVAAAKERGDMRCVAPLALIRPSAGALGEVKTNRLDGLWLGTTLGAYATTIPGFLLAGFSYASYSGAGKRKTGGARATARI